MVHPKTHDQFISILLGTGKVGGLVASLLLLLLSRTAPLHGQAQRSGQDLPKPSSIHKAELLNGLRLVTVQINGATRAAVSLLVKAGSTLDPPQKRGIAYLAAQALRFANEPELVENFGEELEDLRATLEIRTGLESTVFKSEIPTQNVASFLDLLSHMLLHPKFNSERLESLKRQLVASAIESLDPTELATEKLNGLVFGEHSYGKPVHGDSQSLASLSAQDLDDFCKTSYLPNNAALVIVGDLETSRIGEIVREKLGAWVKGSKVEVDLPTISIREAFSILVVKDHQEQVVLAFGNKGTPRSTPDYYALTAMNLVLGGLGDRSLLSRDFLARGIAHQVLESHFQHDRFGGLFQVTTVVPSRFVTIALQTILDAIERLKSSPVEPSELAIAKEQLLNRYLETLKSPSLFADQLTGMELYDLGSDFLLSFPKRVREITLEQIEEVSKNYLSTSRGAAVLVGACEDSISQLQKFGEVKITEKSSNH